MFETRLRSEIESNCYREPAKRAALQLSLILLKRRIGPHEFMKVRELMTELNRRTKTLKF